LLPVSYYIFFNEHIRDFIDDLCRDYNVIPSTKYFFSFVSFSLIGRISGLKKEIYP